MHVILDLSSTRFISRGVIPSPFFQAVTALSVIVSLDCFDSAAVNPFYQTDPGVGKARQRVRGDGGER